MIPTQSILDALDNTPRGQETGTDMNPGGASYFNQILHYPGDLASDGQHSWILFDIYETDSAVFESYRDSQNITALGATAGAAALASTAGGVLGAVGAAAGGTAALSTVLGSFNIFSDHGVQKQGTRYTQPGKQSKQSIALYMPGDIKNSDNMTYADESMAVAGDLIELATKRGTDSVKEMAAAYGLGMGAKTVDSITEIIGQESNVQSLLQNQMRAVANPKMEMVFKGVEGRKFGYEFKFRPKDQSEYDQVTKIIKSFRRHARPTLSSGGRFYLYPSEFDITYMYRGKENSHMHLIKRCVLNSVETSYTDGGSFQVLPDGRPAALSISLNFTETSHITSDDVEKGF